MNVAWHLNLNRQTIQFSRTGACLLTDVHLHELQQVLQFFILSKLGVRIWVTVLRV